MSDGEQNEALTVEEAATGEIVHMNDLTEGSASSEFTPVRILSVAGLPSYFVGFFYVLLRFSF